jgi:hypothetical protein
MVSLALTLFFDLTTSDIPRWILTLVMAGVLVMVIEVAVLAFATAIVTATAGTKSSNEDT